MKNIFAFNIANVAADGTMTPDGNAYITRRASSSVQGDLEEKREAAARVERASSLPLWLLIIEFIAWLVFICCLGGTLKSLADTPLSVMYENAAAVFYVGGAAGIAALALWIAGRIRKKRVMQSPAVPYLTEEMNKAIARAKEDMEIPADAKCIDIFTCCYKVNAKGKIRYKGMCRYSNAEFYAFIRGACLCLSTLEFEASIPLATVLSLQRIDKRAEFCGWNKEKAFNAPEYKPYKIRANQFGILFVKPYFSLRISGSQGDFEILFPPYEEQTLRSLVNVPVA